QMRVNQIFSALRNPPDLRVRYIHEEEICLLHIDGIVDLNLCQESVIKPLLNIRSDQLTLHDMIHSLSALKMTIDDHDKEIPGLLLNGSLIILNDQSKQFLDVKLAKFEKS